MILPNKITPQSFDEQYRLDFDAWAPSVSEVCKVAGVSCSDVVPYTDGSNLVARVNDQWVVKIFPVFHRDQWESERRVLPKIHASSPSPTPRLVAEGELTPGNGLRFFLKQGQYVLQLDGKSQPIYIRPGKSLRIDD
jgi:hypothetical protein